MTITTRTFLAALLMTAALLGVSSAEAQLTGADQTVKPALTADEVVAKVWYRLAGKAPDFAAWARHSEAYLAADVFSRDRVLEEEVAKAADGFGLLVPGELLTADMPVTVSDYSLKTKGYLIESFAPDSFLKFSHAGENFAVVPAGLYDLQWIPADGEAAMRLDLLRSLSESGRDAVLTFELAPTRVSPAEIEADGVSYRVLAAAVVSMAFYDPDGRLVWKQDTRKAAQTEDAAKQDALINLYQ